MNSKQHNTKKPVSLSDSLPYRYNRLHHDQVEAFFAAEGYKLLSDYKNSTTKLNFLCPQGHTHSIIWSSFRAGTRCAYCAGQILTHEDVEKKFAAEGYTLKSQYKRSGDKLKFLCPQGHEHSIAWSDFKDGHRCSFCSGHNVSHERVSEAFANEGLTLKARYKNAHTPIPYVCSKGHEYVMTWHAFQKGQRCIHCANRVAPSHEDVERAFAKEGYILKSQYERGRKKLEFICPMGHTHSMTWHGFKMGYRCAYCTKHGYIKRKPGRLYYIKFETASGPLWKIGITNLTVEERFAKEKTPYAILLDELHEDGSIPPIKERQILTRYKKYLYKGLPVLISGNTECFTKDVLKLDRNIAQLPLPFNIAV